MDNIQKDGELLQDEDEIYSLKSGVLRKPPYLQAQVSELHKKWDAQ